MLRIYKDIIEVIGALQPTVEAIRRTDPALADQLSRALDSVANNVSEGSGSQGRNRRARYHNALGSQYESRTCLELAAAKRYVAPIDAVLAGRIDGIAAVLWTVSR
jgi:four helix bundle protein